MEEEKKKDLYEELDDRIKKCMAGLDALPPGSVAYRSQSEALKDLMAAREAHFAEQNKMEIAIMESSDNKEKSKEENRKWRWSEFWKGVWSVVGMGIGATVNRANVMDIISAEAGGTIVRSTAFKIFDRVGPPKI